MCRCMSAYEFNSVVASCMDRIVETESKGWPLSDVISLKYLTLAGNQLFDKAGKLVQNDARFVFKELASKHVFDNSEVRVLQMLESSLLDVVLHLPVMDRPSNLWALGWDASFKWSQTMPPRCAYEFVELFGAIVFCLINSETGECKSFHHCKVSF